MPDRAFHRPVRKSARTALLASILVHGIVLFLVLWYAPSTKEKPVPSLAVTDFIVLVDGPARRSSGGQDVTVSQVEPPTPPQPAPIAPIFHPQLVEPPPADPVEKGIQPAPAPIAGTTIPGDGRGGTSPSGQGAEFFPVPATARTVVYVLDRSMSMGEFDALRQARTELFASLNRLPPTALFQVIPYNQVAEPLSVHNYGGMLATDFDTLAEVTQAITALRATGHSDHKQALLNGLRLRPDVLFFASDADELTAEQVREVSLNNGGRCAIHVIDFSNRPVDPDSPIRKLALQNRGTYRRVPVKEL